MNDAFPYKLIRQIMPKNLFLLDIGKISLKHISSEQYKYPIRIKNLKVTNCDLSTL